MLTNEEKEILNKLFYEDKNYIFGFTKLYEKVKENGYNIKKSKVLFYYQNQEITQLFKRKNTMTKYKIGISIYPFEKVYVDSMYLTNANITLLNFVDYYSRYAFIFPFKLSKQLSSSKSAKCLEIVIKFALENKFKVINVITDLGSEFLGDFDKICKSNNINHEFSKVGDKDKVAPIETFNRTARSMYEKYKIVYRVNATNINKVIKEINEIYNDTYHTSIKDKPKNYLKKFSMKNKEEEENLDVNTSEGVTNSKLQSDEHSGRGPKVGENVRVYIRDDNEAFNKLTPLWSKEIYKIESLDKKNGYYNVNNKRYKNNELQKVDVNNLMTVGHGNL